jgi:hypothetical protein
MEHLPKLLLTVLEQLSEDKQLCQWNIQANGDFTYVNLRFVSPGHIGQHESTPVGLPGWRKKSNSEYLRDAQRYFGWQSRKQSLDQASSNINIATSNGSSDMKNELYGHDKDTDYMKREVTEEGNNSLTSLPRPTSEHSQRPISPTGMSKHSTQNKQSSLNVNTHHNISDSILPKEDYEKTFVKAVYDHDEQLIRALTKDDAIAIYYYAKSYLYCALDNFNLIIKTDVKYRDHINVLTTSENIINDKDMHGKLKQLHRLYHMWPHWPP